MGNINIAKLKRDKLHSIEQFD